MKQLIKSQLPVFLEGITDYWSELGRIEVVFAQSKNGKPIKEEVWKADGSGNVTRDGDTIYIPWTRAETAQFREGASFYMDIRPTLTNGDDLTVEPVQLTMTWTLFEEDNS